MPLRRLTAEELGRPLALLELGHSQREVGHRLGCSHTVIGRAWSRYQKTGTAQYTHGGGRVRKTTLQQDRYLKIQTTRQPGSTARQLQSSLQHATGVRISTQTARNRLHEVSLRARRPAPKVLLTRKNKAARLLWAREHVSWTDEDWDRCLFTDESKFVLHHHDRRLRVWREKNQRFSEGYDCASTPFWRRLNNGMDRDIE